MPIRPIPGRSYGLWPNVSGTGAVSSQNGDHWFNINDFPIPALYTIGNAGRNILRGPGLSNQDLSLLKNFHFTEHIYLQFRACMMVLCKEEGIHSTKLQLPGV